MSSANTTAAASPPGPGHPDYYPWYNIRADEKANGNYRIYKILIDSDEGRAYNKLTTHDERLEYMRKHHHDTYKVVQPTWCGWVDSVNRMDYMMPRDSPEGQGFERLIKENKGDQEKFEYCRKHAHEVMDREFMAVVVSRPNQDTNYHEKAST